MYTTKSAARLAGIGRSTVPHYAREWADYLSDSAKPPKGQTRYYDDDDIAVFRTVKVLRDQGMTNDQIIEYLESGDRAEPPETPAEEIETPANDDDKALAPRELFNSLIEPLERQIERLESQLETTRNDHLDAEKRAAAAEAKLDMLQNRRPWWKIWG